jgi:hypothetical protein
MNEKLKILFDYYNKFELSDAVIERMEELLDNMFDEESVACPHCGKIFLESENALQYEMRDGDYACECMSPENQAADWADDWVKEQKIGD